MDLNALKSEIDTDPVALGYAAKTDREVADLLNDKTKRTVPRETVEAHRIFERIAAADFPSIGPSNKNRERELLALILGQGTISPGDPNVATLFTDVFGAGSDTIKNLTGAIGGSYPGDDLRLRPIARADELGFGHVREGDVAAARAL